jgi:hypothetical protein
MLFREIVAVYCENHTEHTVWAERRNSEVLKQVVDVVTTGFQKVNTLKYDTTRSTYFPVHPSHFRSHSETYRELQKVWQIVILQRDM